MSDTADNKGDQQESKCAKGVKFLQDNMGYDRLLYVDGVLILVHFVFLIILMLSWLLLVLIFVFRVPRCVLHLLAKRNDSDWSHLTREY